MSKKPILILQLQRMGDLVLTFPLIGWLKSQYPNTPVWVVGEKVFYEGLLKISPPVTYFSYADSHALHSQEYSLIINLSHRPEAAKLTAALKAESKIGPYINDKGNMYISGNWQLYRASVSHNNRHNLFHWSDLNAMDLIPAPTMARTYWPPMQKKEQTQNGKVGLFVGASEANKRPDTDFWVYLAAKFIRMGVKPVLLGGKGDMALAAQIAAKLGAPAINLSGNFSITELCTFIGQLNLFIAPDTGPMHIANWLGVPTLNLSLGPVNAWETAPTSPGQYVLRSSLSCVGCWECTQKSVRCKEGMQAEKVAVIARMLLEGKHEMLAKAEFAGNQLWRTTRDKYGLYNLEPVNGIYPAHLERSKFWKHFFGLQLGFLPQEAEFNLYSAANAMRANGLHTSCVKGGTALLQAVNTAMRNNNFTALQNSDFWLHYPPVMRPLSSYIQFMVNNSDFSKKSLLTALELAEFFVKSVSQ